MARLKIAKQKSVEVILHQKGGGHTFAAALKDRFVLGDEHRGFLHFSRRVATRRRYQDVKINPIISSHCNKLNWECQPDMDRSCGQVAREFQDEKIDEKIINQIKAAQLHVNECQKKCDSTVEPTQSLQQGKKILGLWLRVHLPWTYTQPNNTP